MSSATRIVLNTNQAKKKKQKVIIRMLPSTPTTYTCHSKREHYSLRIKFWLAYFKAILLLCSFLIILFSCQRNTPGLKTGLCRKVIAGIQRHQARGREQESEDKPHSCTTTSLLTYYPFSPSVKWGQ